MTSTQAPTTKDTPEQTSTIDRWAPHVLIGFVALLTILLRIHLIGIPLERDEGEFAYGGQLILDGIPPYRDLYAMKLPGIYAAYAAIMAVFGQTPAGIHIGLIVVNVATVVLLYALARQLRLHPYASVAAAVMYALLSISPLVFGNAAHATQFVMLFAVAGLVVLLRSLDRESLFELAVAGLLVGMAILMKQTGAVFAVFGALWLVMHDAPWKSGNWSRSATRLALFAGCAILPLVITWGLLAQEGLLTKSIFWNFRYASEYVSEIPSDRAWDMFTHNFASVVGLANICFWLLGLAGLGLALFWGNRAPSGAADKPQSRRDSIRKRRNRDQAVSASPPASPVARDDGALDRRGRLFIVLFTLFSILAVVPGYYFRQHYFILMLPALALLAAIPLQLLLGMASTPARVGAAVLFVVAAGVSIAGMRDYLFVFSPQLEVRTALYEHNPFVEAGPIADYLRRHTKPDEPIGIFGSEPEIFFLAHRRSATGHIYMYPLMEDQKYAASMQEQMMHEMERANPRYVVMVSIEPSWLHVPGHPPGLETWMGSYLRNFKTVGVADIVSNDHTEYRWDADAANYKPTPPFYAVWLLERK